MNFSIQDLRKQDGIEFWIIFMLLPTFLLNLIALPSRHFPHKYSCIQYYPLKFEQIFDRIKREYYERVSLYPVRIDATLICHVLVYNNVELLAI